MSGSLEPGVVIGDRYRIVGPLGEGGMGTILVAEHMELGRRVALKVLQDQIGADPSMNKRFEREAKTLAAMAHPNIVALNDYGISDGRAYLVMELLEGRTLRDLMNAERPLPLRRAAGIVQQILRALGYAHERGVIHRDLKPGNVFLQALPDQVDHVKLLDFGFAKFVDGTGTTSLVTGDGLVVGTPTYMAPEQAMPGELDHRADLYALGVLLFEMLAGRRPFVERDALAVVRRRLAEDAPLLSSVVTDRPIAPELDEVLRRALARRREERWQSAAELSRALAALSSDADDDRSDASSDEPVSVSLSVSLSELEAPPPTRSSRGVWIALSVLALIGLAFGAHWLWMSSRAPTDSRPPRLAHAPETRDAGPPDAGPADAGADAAIDAATSEERAVLPMDPWLEAAPPELLAMRRHILRGPPPSERDLQIVAAYARHHHDDARAVLLLAHGYVRMGWVTAAIDRYEEAYGIDRDVRGDPDMLANLIELSGSAQSGARAADRIAVMYGSEALSAIDAAIEGGASGIAQERLEALRDRIGSAP